jgi:hypothetical protein
MTTTTVRAEDQTTQQSTDKREANGRFAKGNKGGPRNPRPITNTGESRPSIRREGLARQEEKDRMNSGMSRS